MLPAIFLILTLQLPAQDFRTLQQAFSNSYTYEYKADYTSAIKELMNVYEDKSYELNLRLGWLNYLAKNYTASLSYYQKAIALMPAATQPLWGILNPQIAQEKWTEADKTYMAILKLDPKNSTACYKLGLNYYYRKDYTNAKKYFDVSLNQHPFDYDILLMSAWTCYFTAQTAEAKILFQKVLLLSPNDASALEGLSMIK